MNNVHFSSKSVDWSTPQDLFDDLDSRWHFTLDPCASDLNHKCSLYYTKEQDGLSKDWSGQTVFCNPPYGRDISKWVKKCFLECSINKVTIVCLLPARTDTAWFHNFILGRYPVRFIRGRLKFNGSKTSAPFPSCLVFFTPFVSIGYEPFK